MKKKIETYLPIFNGFYNSIFDADTLEEDELYNINGIRLEKGFAPVSINDLDFEYGTYYLDTSKDITSSVEAFMKKDFFSKSFKIVHQNLIQPKEYNYRTDSINVMMILTEKDYKKVINYIIKNKESFTKYLKDHYTSYDGFWSHYSNKYEDWIEMLKNEDSLNHVFGSVLDFIFKDSIRELDIYYDISGQNRIIVKNYKKLLCKNYKIKQ